MCLSFPEQGFSAGAPLRPLVRLPGTGHPPSRRLPTPDRSLLDRMELNPPVFEVLLRGDCVRGDLHPSDYAGPSLGATSRPQAPPFGPQPHCPAIWGLPAPPSALKVYCARQQRLLPRLCPPGTARTRARTRPGPVRPPVRTTVSSRTARVRAGAGIPGSVL